MGEFERSLMALYLINGGFKFEYFVWMKCRGGVYVGSTVIDFEVHFFMEIYCIE